MKFPHIVRTVRWHFRSSLPFPKILLSAFRPAASPALFEVDDRYRVTVWRTLSHRALTMLPPAWREWTCERFLRRSGAPGPAAEHLVQYLLSAAKPKCKTGIRKEATIARGADHFYERQYRQYFNPVMGAFAMTASRALLASGGLPHGPLWWRHRKTCAAMLEEHAGASPILVIDRETVAVPLLLPQPNTPGEQTAVDRWLSGHGRMPLSYRELVAGQDIHCAEPRVHARERGADGSLLEVADRTIRSKKLALLALHPHDPDAMGLHITLLAVEMLLPDAVEQEYGLAADILRPWREAAVRQGRMLAFCIGVTEEVFTQCSQNLFIKRPAPRRRPAWRDAWNPALPLERLLAMQFETFQVTVSASGIPGASPRNGDRGRALFLGRSRRKTFLLIPYHPGNAVHGHAAKLWSNGYGTIVIHDDHSALCSVTVSGPARVISHQRVVRDFPSIASEMASIRRRDQTAVPDPEYWYLQSVVQITQQRETLAANSLDPGRPACSINAGGEARHGKKPAYFAADRLPPYDQSLQHEREKIGRQADPSGREHRQWTESVKFALDARRQHLQRVFEQTNVPRAERAFGACDTEGTLTQTP